MQGIISTITCINFFNKRGFVHQSSYIDTPQQNGVPKRKMRHLLNVARALLHHHHVPKNFWGEAVLTIAYVSNRVQSRVLNNQSPFYYLSSFFPNLSLHTPLPLQVFGCTFFVHIPKIHQDKLNPKALKCVFLSYSLTQKGYKCYNPSSQKFYCLQRCHLCWISVLLSLVPGGDWGIWWPKL